MNRLARLLATALITALALVAIPSSAVADLGGTPPPPACTGLGLNCPPPPPPPCTGLGLNCPRPVALVESATDVAPVPTVTDSSSEVDELHSLFAAKTKRIAADAAKIGRLQAKVRQLRERLRSR